MFDLRFSGVGGICLMSRAGEGLAERLDCGGGGEDQVTQESRRSCMFGKKGRTIALDDDDY